MDSSGSDDDDYVPGRRRPLLIPSDDDSNDDVPNGNEPIDDEEESDENVSGSSAERDTSLRDRQLQETDGDSSLPSVGGEAEQILFNVGGEGEENEDSLPSVGGEGEAWQSHRSDENKSGESLQGSDENDEEVDEEEELERVRRSLEGTREEEEGSLPSVGGEEPQGGTGTPPPEVTNAPVGGFRVRVGPDGEEQIEFASDSDEVTSEEESDSDFEMPVNEMMAVEPAVQFALPVHVVASIANRVTGRRYPTVNRAGHMVGHRISDPLDAPRGLVMQRGPVSAVAPIPPRSVIEASLNTPSPSTSRASEPEGERRRPARRRSRRKRAKAPALRQTRRRPTSSPKPLGPLCINEDWDGNDDWKGYSKMVSKMKAGKCHINFRDIEQDRVNERSETSCGKVANGSVTNGTTNADNPDDAVAGPSSRIQSQPVKIQQPSQNSGKLDPTSLMSEGYKIGEVKFDRCGVQKWLWKDKTELLTEFPGVHDILLYVSEQPSGSILHMKVKRTVSGDQAKERTGPPPKLSKRDAQRELIYNVTQHYFYHVDPIGIPADLFSVRGLGNRKTFMLDFNKFDMVKQRYVFDVVLLGSAIVGNHDVHNIPVARSPVMQDVFANFLGVAPPPPPPDEEARRKEDVDWFYGQIRKYHKQEHIPPPNFPVQPSCLKPELRNYQRDAVRWMLYREGCIEFSENNIPAKVNLAEAFLKKMYIPVQLTKHTIGDRTPVQTVSAFYNPHTTYICWSLPKIPPLPSGGILCDEMGLGKTVETLSLILLNKKPIPDELEEYFHGEDANSIEKLEQNHVDNEEEMSNSVSSWQENDSVSDADASSSISESVSTNRKRKKRGKGGGRKKKPKKSVSVKAQATNRIFGRRRGRAASPCEFSTTMDDSTATQLTNDSEDVNANADNQSARRPARRSAMKARVTTKAALEAIEKSLNVKKKRPRKGSVEERPSRSPVKTYDALKILYDSALSDYRFADEAKVRPRFHGKFYEASIEMRESFECICGEMDDFGPRSAPIVKCSLCGSSQHMECVGFDEDIQKLFTTLDREYLCPHCEALEIPFETKSTLIITPPSISHQWIKEIQRHVKDQKLSILFYKGVSYHGYIPPSKLARYDLVITTYNVLSAELDYVDLPHCNSTDGRRFRNPKRFLTIPSPLPSVMWWRVCLDEAQMVEGISTKMSMMAMRIQAVHRWCVTGTPVSKGLQDLFGLFVFLKVYPVSYDVWWAALVRNAFFRKETELLYELFGQLIWRNGKKDVLDQLGIPAQTEVVHWLNFSPVETHFYKQQFEICSNRILEKIQRLQRLSPDLDVLNVRLSSLDRFSVHGLLAPFLELRQACCHPQIVKGQLISLQKGTLTMEELLDKLVKKTQLQCLDDHRLIVAALNGHAGLHIIRNQWIQAAEKYREVLQSAEKYKEHFHTDSLQLLHTMENLAEILDGNHNGIAFTLRDGSLRSDAAELRKKYMKKYADAVQTAQDVASQHTKVVEEVRDQFTMFRESWWVAALKAAQNIQKIDGLILSLKQDLMDVTKKNVKTTNSVANKFYERSGLEKALVPAILSMDQLRDSVLTGLQELQGSDPIQFVDTAIRCHLRQQTKSNSYYNDSASGEEKCKLCMYHDNFLIYESEIFKTDMRDKITRTGRNWQQRKQLGELTDDLELSETTKNELLQQEAEDLKATTGHVQLINEELRRGTWGDSETEVLLKGILRFARVNRLSHEITENGGVHVKLLDAMKKEFRYLRILWRQIFDQVSALDELSQATTRLIAVSGEVQTQHEQPTSSNKIKQLSSGVVEKTLKIQNIHVIGYHEVEMKMNQMQTDYVTGHESLSLHLGQLLYLKTLKRNGYGKRGTLNTEDCPICSIQLGKEWTVLRCGHSFCSECVKKMCPNTLHSFLCPLCRHSMKFADVSFVDTTENEEVGPGTSSGQVEPVRKQVKGSHSTKVEAIIDVLLRLQDSNPGEKCIIFSTWNDVLDIIANALNQNDIKYSLLNQPGRPFHANLDKFKEREDLQVLLMPLTSGAKGLNIIEATHVVLVEPILNLSSELQAIGRVHRIGQKKPTFVHRFYVKRTIEEKLFQILKVQDISSDEEGSLTVNDLQNLITLTVSK